MAGKKNSIPMWERLLEFGERYGGIINVADAIAEFWADGGDLEFRDRRSLAARVYISLAEKRSRPIFERTSRGIYEILHSKEEHEGVSPYGSLSPKVSQVMSIRLQDEVFEAIAQVPDQASWVRDAIVDKAVREGYLVDRRGDRA